MDLKKNQIITVPVEETNMLGYGVAKYNGAVIFIQNAVEGDLAEIRIIKCAKNYYVARIERLLESSPWRVEPSCPHFKRCGGCVFQSVQYRHEKEIKRRYVESCLLKAGIADIPVKDVLSCENITRYRNKAQYPLSVREDGTVVAGFYSPKTHTVCPVEDCMIQDEDFSPVVLAACDYFTKHHIPPYDENEDSGLVRHLYLRKGKKTEELMLCLVLREDCFPDEEDFARVMTSQFPKLKSLIFNINSHKTNVILGDRSRLIFGQEKIREELCGRTFELSHRSFFQVNRDAAELLYQTAFSLAEPGKHDLILDLFCGIGSIGLSVDAQVDLIGVEIVEDAVRDAAQNAKINHLDRATFVCGDATDAFCLIGAVQAKKPLLILDPPRKGLSKELISDIVTRKISDVLYISCAADTLARDLALFVDAGYQCASVQPVDLFPRTGHVENVVYLQKNMCNS